MSNPKALLQFGDSSFELSEQELRDISSLLMVGIRSPESTLYKTPADFHKLFNPIMATAAALKAYVPPVITPMNRPVVCQMPIAYSPADPRAIFIGTDNYDKRVLDEHGVEITTRPILVDTKINLFAGTCPSSMIDPGVIHSAGLRSIYVMRDNELVCIDVTKHPYSSFVKAASGDPRRLALGFRSGDLRLQGVIDVERGSFETGGGADCGIVAIDVDVEVQVWKVQ